ncbi:MAG TPA: efflux RND transporter periplasmic adaptor subunit [Acetobacteraceae bacterium]|nr:efflux RND transporter periplasmic adaptor subunit [Acetobacteraceae bacterium]
MDDLSLTEEDFAERRRAAEQGLSTPARRGRWRLLLFASLLGVAAFGSEYAWRHGQAPAAPPPPPPPVTVSQPLQRDVQPAARFLGQFSAVDTVELRAQVGGTLTAIDFRDGQIVHKGDPLFVIDPRPFQIRLDQAVAQFQTAQAKATLTGVELWRAQQLKRTEFGTAETVDERAADQRTALAAIDAAKAAIMDARLDLEFARIAAPFTGRIGAHLVSVGSLVSGSRGGTSPTTLLATIVRLDPIYIDFDMSESDYRAYRRAVGGAGPRGDVAISLDGDGHFDRHGTLDFIDNVVNRSSGTIHARATVPNPDLSITPGQFARLRLALGKPAPVLLVPAAAVIPDQSRHVVMTVAPDGTVVPKVVETGALYGGLRAIRSGLRPGDRVIIDGLVRARPGSRVTPVKGAIAPDAGADPG